VKQHEAACSLSTWVSQQASQVAEAGHSAAAPSFSYFSLSEIIKNPLQANARAQKPNDSTNDVS
jgi:hypothetical protein